MNKIDETVIKEKDGEHPLGHAGQSLALVAFMTVWVADSFFLHWSTIPARHVPLSVRLGLFGLTLVATIPLLSSTGAVLHHGRRPVHVIETGSFRYVRHPLYLGSFLVYVGLTFVTASLLSLALLPPIFLFYNYIASYEEKLLEAKFGEGYKNYKARTGKWVPRLKRRRG